MPAKTGPSSCSAVLPILPRPRARSVPRCFSDWPIWLRTWVTLTFAIFFPLRSPVREHFLDGQAAHFRDLVGTAEPLQPVDGCLGHVDRVRRAETLRKDVADSGQLEHRSHSAAGAPAGSFARRPQEHARGVGASKDLVRDRRAVLRHGEEILLRVLDRLRDRKRHLARLAVADTDPVDFVADHDESGEREPPAALDDLRDAVDLDDALFELPALLALDDGALDTHEFRPGRHVKS